MKTHIKVLKNYSVRAGNDTKEFNHKTINSFIFTIKVIKSGKITEIFLSLTDKKTE